MMWKRRLPAVCVAGLLLAGCSDRLGNAPAADAAAIADVSPGALRLTGTVEAVRSRSVTAPRLRGASTLMIITSLIPGGTRVEEGDLLVVFDRQEQERLAFEARAEVAGLDGQIAKKRADQAAADAKDQTELVEARNNVTRAELSVRTNDLIAPVEAEKNDLLLEQARARLEQLETTYKLKREAAAADLTILEIQRTRALRSLEHADNNAALMEIRAPFAGLVVIKTMYRSGAGYVQIMEGDEVRAGNAIVDIVDTSAMQVRARVNQADSHLIHAGQDATVRLDGFPGVEFAGTVEQVNPLATSSAVSDDVRSLTALVSIDGGHEQLLPDLTASVEVRVAVAEPPPSRNDPAGGRP